MSAVRDDDRACTHGRTCLTVGARQHNLRGAEAAKGVHVQSSGISIGSKTLRRVGCEHAICSLLVPKKKGIPVVLKRPNDKTTSVRPCTQRARITSDRRKKIASLTQRLYIWRRTTVSDVQAWTQRSIKLSDKVGGAVRGPSIKRSSGGRTRNVPTS